MYRTPMITLYTDDLPRLTSFYEGSTST